MWTLKIDNKELLLSDEPLPTWPFGNLGDVAQINVLSTRSVRIPSNPTSDVFFEHINRFNVNSDLPTRQVVVSVLYYGEPVIYNGIVEKIEYSGQDYTVIISGDNGVLRSLLKDTLQALDWSAYTIPYTLAQISDDIFVGGGSFPVPVTPALTYANAWRSKNFDDGLLYDGIPTTDAQQRILCLPGVQLATVLSEILLQNGLQQIDLSNTDFLNLPEFSELYLAFSTLDREPIPPTLNFEIPEQYYPTPGQSYFMVLSPVAATDYFEVTTDRVTIFQASVLSISITTTSTVIFTMTVYRQKSNGDLVSVNVISSFTGMPYTEQAAQGDFYTFEFDVPLSAPDPYTSPLFSVSFTITNIDMLLGSTYYTQHNIPPIKQLDVIKYIALKYGLLVDFDTFTNTLVWYNYGTLFDAYTAGNYIDLTNKIVNTRKLGFDFSGNFSKSNQLNYTNESGMQPQQGRGLFAVDNYNLPEIGEFGKTTFGFSDSLFSVQRQVAVLPYAKVIREENAIVNTELETINNRVVRLHNQPRATTFRRYWIMDTVDFQHSVDTFYTDFVASNENYRLVTVQADLSYSDVKLLASKTEKLPVLVSLPNLQGVFLVVKIDRFSENRPTSIQLKKLL